MFNFEVLHTCGDARMGILQTPHGLIETPAFVFCATKAAIKSAAPETIQKTGTQIILSNTYHLMVNGGSEIIKKAGGIHKFMGWDGPLLTDSGGFQIFSLGHGSVADEIKRKQSSDRKKSLVNITEEGALFRSHVDGTKHFLTPEKSMQVQSDIGADIVLTLDECTPFNVDKSYTENSMMMSHRWEERSKLAFDKLQSSGVAPLQAIYGIVQGGIYEDLRKMSTDFVTQQDFFGIAIGGSLGSTKEQMYDIASYTCRLLEKTRPRHLLGIGIVSDIVRLSLAGIDTFDCVHPTRIARHGVAIVPYSTGEISDVNRGMNMRNSRFKEDMRPICQQCQCYTCQNFSRAYINYLLKIEEMLAMTLLTTHNLQQMNNLMYDIRMGIKNKAFNLVLEKWMGNHKIESKNDQ